jgi:hypothetical protein
MPSKKPSRKFQQAQVHAAMSKPAWKYKQFQRLDRQRRAGRGK